MRALEERVRPHLLVLVAVLLVAALLMLPINISLGLAQASGTSVNPWWPAQGAQVSGTQPFKADVPGLSPDQYEMFWQVDGGGWNWMATNYTDYPHKEVAVDLSGWNWKGNGPYKITFIAQQHGAVIAERSVDIYVAGGQPASVALEFVEPQPQQQLQQSVQTGEVSREQVQTVAAAMAPATESYNTGHLKLYVDSNTPAARQASEWRQSRPSDAQKMDVLANSPTAVWLGGWSGNVEDTVRTIVGAAQQSGATPTFVAYNIPGRDCGGYSAGGVGSRDAYTSWIGGIARGIGSASAIVILEPDAAAALDCLSSGDKETRLGMLSSAVSILKSNGNTKVYVDAGHSGWVDSSEMAARLQRAGVGNADGFALNVSNFNSTSAETSYGSQISDKLGGKRFVIDTARNGNGSNGEWCNPWGRAIGERPTTSTGNSRIDAYLWLKTPGESDGNCNGGPNAGHWWADYALSLVR